jgi:hypothetical protein
MRNNTMLLTQKLTSNALGLSGVSAPLIDSILIESSSSLYSPFSSKIRTPGAPGGPGAPAAPGGPGGPKVKK